MIFCDAITRPGISRVFLASVIYQKTILITESSILGRRDIIICRLERTCNISLLSSDTSHHHHLSRKAVTEVEGGGGDTAAIVL